jgi:hypothetical protein
MKVELNENENVFGGYTSDSNIFSQDFTTFTNDCAGRLCIAIGEGKFRSELYNALTWAFAKGMKRQHDLLIQRAHEEKKNKNKK